MISAFDEAVMSPFISDKPTHKKWQCRESFSSETTATTIPDNFEDEEIVPMIMPVEETIFFSREEDLEAAIFQERHEGIVDINQSMRQINTIQAGKHQFQTIRRSSEHDSIRGYLFDVLPLSFVACFVIGMAKFISLVDVFAAAVPIDRVASSSIYCLPGIFFGATATTVRISLAVHD